ncbi:hypothetical protein HDU93_002063 [Gonapodya sp. JEL0774]|nr:hypothetical protein HDU93_002063 [Gonapodya sp. JEL0774]
MTLQQLSNIRDVSAMEALIDPNVFPCECTWNDTFACFVEGTLTIRVDSLANLSFWAEVSLSEDHLARTRGNAEVSLTPGVHIRGRTGDVSTSALQACVSYNHSDDIYTVDVADNSDSAFYLRIPLALPFVSNLNDSEM